MVERVAQRIGGRKLAIGLLYLLGSFVCIETAIIMQAGAGVISSVAGAAVALAPGIGIIIWGNVQEHRVKNGHGGES